jgi:hypothetical protein
VGDGEGPVVGARDGPGIGVKAAKADYYYKGEGEGPSMGAEDGPRVGSSRVGEIVG